MGTNPEWVKGICFERHDKQHCINTDILLKFSSNLSPTEMQMHTMPNN